MEVLIVILILFIVSIIYSHFVIDKTRYEFKNKKFDKNIKILFLSDLHNRKIYKIMIEIVDIEKPDIIIFGGDMTNNSIKDTKRVIELINKLNSKVYYTFGNHEELLSKNDMDEYLKRLGKTNVILLNNKSINLSNNINLIGFNSGIEAYHNFNKPGLDKKYIIDKIGNINNKKYNIMIAHNPIEFDSYVESNVDLVLCGHIHGGLARLPFIGGILSPDFTLFPKYDSGLFIKGRTRMIVSRGLGYCKLIPFRIFNPGEVVIINLIKD